MDVDAVTVGLVDGVRERGPAVSEEKASVDLAREWCPAFFGSHLGGRAQPGAGVVTGACVGGGCGVPVAVPGGDVADEAGEGDVGG